MRQLVAMGAVLFSAVGGALVPGGAIDLVEIRDIAFMLLGGLEVALIWLFIQD